MMKAKQTPVDLMMRRAQGISVRGVSRQDGKSTGSLKSVEE